MICSRCGASVIRKNQHLLWHKEEDARQDQLARLLVTIGRIQENQSKLISGVEWRKR